MTVSPARHESAVSLSPGPARPSATVVRRSNRVTGLASSAISSMSKRGSDIGFRGTRRTVATGYTPEQSRLMTMFGKNTGPKSETSLKRRIRRRSDVPESTVVDKQRSTDVPTTGCTILPFRPAIRTPNPPLPQGCRARWHCWASCSGATGCSSASASHPGHKAEPIVAATPCHTLR
jgi:hypothetical protein